MTATLPVWDIWVRIGHWAVVAAIAFQWFSGEELSWIDAHATVGILLFGWVAFRIIWGFTGPTYARFAAFTPKSLGAASESVYCLLKGTSESTPGHTAIGGVGVYALMGLIALAALTGMASSDDIFFEGPLAPLVTNDLVEFASRAHSRITDLLFIVIALHIAAIAWHTVKLKEPLLAGMWHGRKPAHGQSAGVPAANSQRIWLRGFVFFSLCLGGAYGVFALYLGW
jgi:cytochrome b